MAGVSPAVGVRWFRQAGGMPPVTLAPLSGRYLSFASGRRSRSCARRSSGCARSPAASGRSPSTISRELRRNAATRSGAVGLPGVDGAVACRAARPASEGGEAGREPRAARVRAGSAGRARSPAPDGGAGAGPEVRWIGRRHGRREDRRWAKAWSPEQIAHRLRVDFPDDESMRISHEAIYQALYVQGRGALRRELTACLRTGRALRVPRARARGRGKRFVSPEVMISERPAEAEDRAVPGHWEGDLILGLEQLGDRHAGRAHDPVHDAAAPARRWKATARSPGQERSRAGRPRRRGGPRRDRRRDHHAARAAAPVADLGPGRRDGPARPAARSTPALPVYFCDPHSPWQRGTNENTNGLLRQYFPKGTDLARHSADDLAAVAAALNGRPRKTLGWRTPAEALDEYLYSCSTRRCCDDRLNPPVHQ